MARKYGYGQNEKLAKWFVQTIRDAQEEKDDTESSEKPTCATCGGSGKMTYTWSISAKSKGTTTVRCLACQPKPEDPYRYAS
jgi:hypothetical protein